MSGEDMITKRDVAKLIKDAKNADLEPGDGIAQRVAMVNVVWSVWGQVGAVETEAEISEAEAQELIEEMPLSYEDVEADS